MSIPFENTGWINMPDIDIPLFHAEIRKPRSGRAAYRCGSR